MGLDDLPIAVTVREMFETSRTAMLLVNDGERYVAANEAAVEMFGWPAEEIVGTHITDTTPDAHSTEFERELERVLNADSSIIGRRLWRRADGPLVDVDYCRTPNIADGIHLTVYVLHVPETTPTFDGPGAPTPRELEILRLLALGRTGAQIASDLHFSPATVRTHIRNVMGKLGAQTRAHLIAMAIRDGLVAV